MTQREPEEDWDEMEKEEKETEKEEAESDEDEPGKHAPLAVVGKKKPNPLGRKKQKKGPRRR
jgi:hypothetical protein